jgi:hypothetical protein
MHCHCVYFRKRSASKIIKKSTTVKLTGYHIFVEVQNVERQNVDIQNVDIRM